MKAAVIGSRKSTVGDLGQYLPEETTEIVSGGLVQRRLYCPDGRTGSPNCTGAFATVLYRAALRLSRCADNPNGFQNHRLRKNRHQQLVQSGAHQVFPEKQCQPHSEGLFGGVLLLYLLSHYHPQIAVAHPHPARLFKLAENP